MERICSIPLSSSLISSASVIMFRPSPLLAGMVVAAAAVVEVAGSLDLAMYAHRTIRPAAVAVVVVGVREVMTGVVADAGWGIAKGNSTLCGAC